VSQVCVYPVPLSHSHSIVQLSPLFDWPQKFNCHTPRCTMDAYGWMLECECECLCECACECRYGCRCEYEYAKGHATWVAPDLLHIRATGPGCD